MRWAEHVAYIADSRRTHRVLVGRPEENRSLGRTRRNANANIKMDLTEVTWGGMNWVVLAQDTERLRAVVNVIMNLRVPYNAGNFWTI
jgi:hypothetical protein